MFPPCSAYFFLISSPKQDKKHTPSHPAFILLPRQNKGFFIALEALLQEAKIHTPTTMSARK